MRETGTQKERQAQPSRQAGKPGCTQAGRGLQIRVGSEGAASADRPAGPALQMAVLLRKLEEFCRPAGGDAVVICGDFNSTPDSGLYQLLASGTLPHDHAHAVPKDTTLPAILGPAGLLQHGLGLQSAYAAGGCEPGATNVKGAPENFAACLDYVFASAHLGPPVACLPVPSLDELRAEGGGLPSSRIPSDHVPIGAVFRLPPAGAAPLPVRAAHAAGCCTVE
jgi:endonuclease/exonuclease/phosphatase family metal-dependent hydrolase